MNDKKRIKEAKKQGLPVETICPQCYCVMHPVYENNGFSAPDPEHVELTGYNCPCCGYKE